MPATPRDHARALSIVLETLRSNPRVVAIGAYGSTAGASWSPTSDIDLVAVLDTEPAVESIRLRVGSVPVDVIFAQLLTANVAARVQLSCPRLNRYGILPKLFRRLGLQRANPTSHRHGC